MIQFKKIPIIARRDKNMEIKKIAKIINKNGGRLYYVGGYVRDKIMNNPSKDIDFCVVGISKEQFLNLFPEAFLKGNFFPVFQLYDYEFAFARKEVKTDLGHNGFSYNIKNISITDDLMRRDITINSIALDVLTDELIDPFNGVKDIENKIIRATSSHFTEDPLRVYRVAQFASRFNFAVSDETKKFIKSMKKELSALSAERVFEELNKALKSEKPSVFFNTLKECELLDIHFKEINDLIGVSQPLKYHPEGDAYNHSMDVLDKVSKLTNDVKTRFAALTHDLGKAKTSKEILPHHYMHEKNGVEPVQTLCNRLKTPNNWKKLAVVTVKEHMRAGLFNEMSIAKKVDFLERNSKYLSELEIIAKVDSKNPELSFYDLGQKMLSEINGNTVNLPKNKEAKAILHEKRISWMRKRR